MPCDEMELTAVLDIGIGYLSPWFLDNAHLVLYLPSVSPRDPPIYRADLMPCYVRAQIIEARALGTSQHEWAWQGSWCHHGNING